MLPAQLMYFFFFLKNLALQCMKLQLWAPRANLFKLKSFAADRGALQPEVVVTLVPTAVYLGECTVARR